MSTPRRWRDADLALIAAARELRIAAGGDRRWPVPIWVVVTDGSVYVRTWHRRTTGWYGRALETGRARVEVPGLSCEVAVVDVAAADSDSGAGGPDLRAAVDDAFRAKYGSPGDASVSGMITDDAAATTLRLTPADGTD